MLSFPALTLCPPTSLSYIPAGYNLELVTHPHPHSPAGVKPPSSLICITALVSWLRSLLLLLPSSKLFSTSQINIWKLWTRLLSSWLQPTCYLCKNSSNSFPWPMRLCMIWLVLCPAPSSHAAFPFSPVHWLDCCPVSSLNMPSAFQPEDLRTALFSACDTQCSACGVAVPSPPLGQRRQRPWEAVSDHIISVGPSLLFLLSLFLLWFYATLLQAGCFVCICVIIPL